MKTAAETQRPTTTKHESPNTHERRPGEEEGGRAKARLTRHAS